MVDNRYNRQELIEGWKQESLDKARVVIVGADQLANFTAVSLSALGVGNVEIYDASKISENEQGFLLSGAKAGTSKAQGLETILREINPGIKVKGMSMKLENSPLISVLGKPNLIVDVTNSSASKQTVIKYGQAKGIPVMTAACDSVRGEIYLANPENQVNATLPDYNSLPQGAVTSEIVAGLITEETRKVLMPMGTEKPIKSLAYSLATPRRFSKDLEEQVSQSDLSGKKVLVIGAGALGNFATLGLTLAGVGNIDIIDYDDIESTNLNRQILFYNSVGKMKAEVLAERLKKIRPSVKVNGIVGKIDQNSGIVAENKYDLILDCVDSFAVRASINYLAVRNNVPLVSGGTNPSSGQVVVYVPGKSACLDCTMHVEDALAKQMRAATCRYAPDPSVIMTNEIIGGMMVGEALKVLDAGYGTPVSRILKYDSKAGARGGLVGAADPCHCVKPEPAEWVEQVKAKYKEEK
ncbi:ThiF family adenylyltransferase [Candidatus Pacearchaeota archaeon]|nr:ThiF family adenylyltransferase [Candidatus Pacearchaeota archaeon]